MSHDMLNFPKVILAHNRHYYITKSIPVNLILENVKYRLTLFMKYVLSTADTVHVAVKCQIITFMYRIFHARVKKNVDLSSVLYTVVLPIMA